MNIIVLSTYVPFVSGGAEYLTAGLVHALEDQGHVAELVKIPFADPRDGQVLSRMKACQSLTLHDPDFSNVDLVIGMKFPSYLVRHPQKTLWIMHQYRQAYDLWDLKMGHLVHENSGEQTRQAIIESDNEAIGKAKGVYAISKNVASRLQKYNNVHAQHIYSPPPMERQFFGAPAKEYILCLSRVVPLKRQHLIMQALQHTEEDVRIVFTGQNDDNPYYQRLIKIAAELGVGDRVTWVRPVSDDDKLRLYSEALAVAFTPVDEDYGYVTLESMLSGKAVLTTTDAGGVTEFVTDQINGIVTQPDPIDIAAGLDRLWQDRQATKAMGEAGRDCYWSMEISWPNAIDRLLS